MSNFIIVERVGRQYRHYHDQQSETLEHSEDKGTMIPLRAGRAYGGYTLHNIVHSRSEDAKHSEEDNVSLALTQRSEDIENVHPEE